MWAPMAPIGPTQAAGAAAELLRRSAPLSLSGARARAAGGGGGQWDWRATCAHSGTAATLMRQPAADEQVSERASESRRREEGLRRNFRPENGRQWRGFGQAAGHALSLRARALVWRRCQHKKPAAAASLAREERRKTTSKRREARSEQATGNNKRRWATSNNNSCILTIKWGNHSPDGRPPAARRLPIGVRRALASEKIQLSSSAIAPLRARSLEPGASERGRSRREKEPD